MYAILNFSTILFYYLLMFSFKIHDYTNLILFLSACKVQLLYFSITVISCLVLYGNDQVKY